MGLNGEGVLVGGVDVEVSEGEVVGVVEEVSGGVDVDVFDVVVVVVPEVVVPEDVPDVAVPVPVPVPVFVPGPRPNGGNCLATRAFPALRCAAAESADANKRQRRRRNARRWSVGRRMSETRSLSCAASRRCWRPSRTSRGVVKEKMDRNRKRTPNEGAVPRPVTSLRVDMSHRSVSFLVFIPGAG